MKTWTFSALAAVALVAVSASAESTQAPGKSGSTPAPRLAQGKVNIVCNPSCDEVVVAGRSFGPSPVVGAQLPAGTHEVTLKRKTQVDARKQIVVTAGQTTSYDFALTSQAAPKAPPAEIAGRVAAHMRLPDGWLAIQCDPGCDDVVVDGKKSLGRNPTNVALSPGEHEIIAKRKGVPDQTKKVRIVEGQTTAVRLLTSGPFPAPVDSAVLRKQLEAKVAAGTASQEDIKTVRAICLQQGDKACVANMDARLRPAPSR